MAERVTSSDGLAASLTGRGVQQQNPVDGVAGGEANRVVGVIGAGTVPWRRHRQPEQAALEPTIFCPSQVLDDPQQWSCPSRAGGGRMPAAKEHPRARRPRSPDTSPTAAATPWPRPVAGDPYGSVGTAPRANPGRTRARGRRTSSTRVSFGLEASKATSLLAMAGEGRASAGCCNLRAAGAAEHTEEVLP